MDLALLVRLRPAAFPSFSSFLLNPPLCRVFFINLRFFSLQRTLTAFSVIRKLQFFSAVDPFTTSPFSFSWSLSLGSFVFTPGPCLFMVPNLIYPSAGLMASVFTVRAFRHHFDSFRSSEHDASQTPLFPCLVTKSCLFCLA